MLTVWGRVAFAMLLAGPALAQPLAVPASLVDLRTPQGEQMLAESDALDSFIPLSIAFVTQQTQAFCGVASIVTVLNALSIPAPSTPEYEPYRTFTQDNLLDDRAEAVLPRKLLARQGMTLDELGRLLALHPVETQVHHAADAGLDEFRAAARAYVGIKDRAVVVNYLRRSLGQERGGHISPLAAYDPRADSFLIMDVARYKYPPVWVKTGDLFQAMNTPDSDNGGKTRGYVLVSKIAADPTIH